MKTFLYFNEEKVPQEPQLVPLSSVNYQIMTSVTIEWGRIILKETLKDFQQQVIMSKKWETANRNGEYGKLYKKVNVNYQQHYNSR